MHEITFVSIFIEHSWQIFSFHKNSNNQSCYHCYHEQFQIVHQEHWAVGSNYLCVFHQFKKYQKMFYIKTIKEWVFLIHLTTGPTPSTRKCMFSSKYLISNLSVVSMCSLVSCKSRRFSKTSPTHITGVRFLSCMYSQVRI